MHCPIFSDKLKSLRAKVRAGISSSGSMHTLSCKLSFVAIAIDVAKSVNFSESLLAWVLSPPNRRDNVAKFE